MKNLIPVLLLVVGAATLSIGLVMPRYHDPESYHARYAELRQGQSKEFRELRKASLTVSFELQDYGFTLLSLVPLAFAVTRWRTFYAYLPARKITAGLLGIAAIASTVVAYVGSLILDFERGEFPWWADSLGIPLMAVLPLTVLLILWCVPHIFLARSGRPVGWRLFWSGWGIWLGLLAITTSVVLLVCAATGDFWAVLPLTLWSGFYLALWNTRSEA